MRPDEHDGQAFITPAIQEDAGLYTLVNWTYRMGVPDAIEKPETTFVNVIYRDGTEGHLLAKNVAWSQVHQFRIESKGEELGGEPIPLAQERGKKYLEGARVHFVKIDRSKMSDELLECLMRNEMFVSPDGPIGTMRLRAMRELEFDLPDPNQQPTIAEQFPHYFKDVSHLDTIDIYRVIDLWGVTDSAIAHAIKKLLVAGGRGAKDAEQDVAEAIVSLRRWQEMQAENATDESSES